MDRPTFTNICEATSQSHELDNMRPIHRKGKKLLAEKKRRARINNCLIQIRDLVCEGEDEKDSDIDKMEKAEILEKTLEVLTRFRREYNTVSFPSCSGSSSSLHSSPSARQVMAVRYASGFSSCAEESIRYIQSSRLVPAEVKAQLQSHLRSIARRMENRVVEVDAGPAVSPAAVQFPHQYSVHPYPTPASAVYPRSVSASLAGTDHVSSSGQPEEESASGFRIPSPIHSSTPVTTHPYQRDQENILGVKCAAALASEVPASLQASRRYECITPEIDVVAEADDTNESAFSQPQATRQQYYQQRLAVTELTTSRPVDPTSSPRLPLTATPIYSPQQQTYLNTPPPSNYKKRGLLQASYSSQPSASAVFSYPYQDSNTQSPRSAFSSPITPPSSQTIFTYQGYEPLPATPVATTTPARQCFHPLSSSEANTLSSPGSVRSSTVKPQPTLSTPALDLCVKRHGSHQISPETMWRPW